MKPLSAKIRKWSVIIWGGFNAGAVLGLLDSILYVFFGLYSTRHFGGVIGAVIIDVLGMGVVGSLIVGITFCLTGLFFRLSYRNKALTAGSILLFCSFCLSYYNFSWSFKTRAVASGKTQKNVILITIDTLRSDALGSTGNAIIRTPTLDRLVRTGWQFLNVVCPVPMTTPSHASILTSTIPAVHGALENRYRLSKSNYTLTECLYQKGYRTAAFVSAFPLDARFGLNQGFMLYDDDFSAPGDLRRVSWLHVLLKLIHRNRLERNCRWTNSLVLPWLNRYGKEGSFFLWIHYFDAHAPYIPDDIEAEYYKNKYQHPYQYETKQAEVKASFAVGFRKDRIEPGRPEELYWGEVSTVDREIDRLIQRLLDLKLWENTYLVVVSDHGESFGEHGRFYTHGEDIFEPALSVPLMFVGEGFPHGRLSKRYASLLDITPTLLSVLGFDKHIGMKGFDLSDKEEKRTYALVENYGLIMSKGSQKQRGVRTMNCKFIFEPETNRTLLFDLFSDPNESNDLCNQKIMLCDKFKNLTLTGFRQARETSNKTNPDVSDRTLNKLKSLGYAL